LATTDIQASITAITGAAPDSNILKDAQKAVVSSVPKNLLKWASTFTELTDGGNTSNGVNIVMPEQTDNILSVTRNGYSADEVGYEMQGFINSGSTSLFAPTNKFPNYYLDNSVTNKGVIVIVKPEPSDAQPAKVLYVDYNKIGDESDLRSAVVFRAISGEYSKLARTGIPSWTSPISPTPPAVPNFGADSSIDSSPPIPPSLSSSSVDTSGWVSPSYTKQVASLTPNPSIADLSISAVEPTTPIAPSFTYSDASVDSIVKPLITVSDMANASSVPTYESQSVVLPSLEVDSFPSMSWDFPSPPVSPSLNSNSISFEDSLDDYIIPISPTFDFSSVVQSLSAMEMPSGVVLPSLDYDATPSASWNFPNPPVPDQITAQALSSIASYYPVYNIPVCPIYDFASVTQALEVLALPPEIIIPQLNIETPPSITWNIPSAPVAPTLDWSGITQVVEDLDLPPDIVVPSLAFEDAPTIAWNFPSAPVSPSYDYADVDDWINNEEDSEMAASRIQAIQTQVSGYGAEVQSFQTLVNSEIAENQGKIKAWSDEWQTRVSKYSTELNALVNKYQGEATGKSSIIQSQVAVLNAQLQEIVQKNTAEVNTYQANIQAYQTKVNAEVTENQGRIQVWGSEWTTRVQAYSAEVSAIVSSYSTTQQGKAQVSDSQVKIFQAQLGLAQADYTNGLQRHQNEMANASKEFDKNNAIFNMEAQKILEQGKLDNSHQERLVQQYLANIQGYQAEVNAIIQQNTAEIAAWQNEWSTKTQKYSAEVSAIISAYQAEVGGESQVSESQVSIFTAQLNKVVGEHQLDITKYQADINNNLNIFNKSNTEYQASLQVAIQDAQLSSQDDAQAIQKYSTEVQAYSSEVNNIIQQNTAEISAWQNEWGLKTQVYTAEVGAVINKYQAELQDAVNVFNKENVIYQEDIQNKVQNLQKDLQLAIQETQSELHVKKSNIDNSVQLALQNAIQGFQKDVQEYASSLQKFGADVGLYQQTVNAEIQEYTINEIQKELAIWQTNIQSDMQIYSSDMQNELNKFNELNSVFQAQVQKSIQDAQLESADDGQLLQKYSAEMQEYQQNINKEIADFTNTLNKNVQEYQSEVALFSSEITNFQALIAEQAQSGTLDQQTVAFYEKESSKYYQWAQNEITTYIQNNSKMIQQTMAAQVAAQQQGQ
jgi:hypothetical protein